MTEKKGCSGHAESGEDVGLGWSAGPDACMEEERYCKSEDCDEYSFLSSVIS